MGNRFHVEAWSLPFATTAQVVARVPFIRGSFDSEVGRAGRGSLTLRADYPLLDSIISETAATYLRVYQDNVLIPEASFFAKRLARNLEDQAVGLVTITGPAFDHVLDWAQLENFDYPTQPTQDPIWRWGNTDNAGTFTNGTLDDDPDGLGGNGGFENGVTTPFGSTPTDAYFREANAVQTSTTTPRTGSVSMFIDASGVRSGAVASIDVQGGSRYQFQGYGRDDSGPTGDSWLMGVEIETGATIHSANGWSENGWAWIEIGNAVKGAGAATLTYQAFDLDITFPAEQETARWCFVHNDTGQPSFHVDDVSIDGPGIGLSPWLPALYSTNFAATPTLDTFQISSTRAYSGTYSLQFKANVPAGSTYYKAGVGQKITGLALGRTYTWIGWVTHDGGSTEDFRLILKRPNGEWVASTPAGTFTVPTGTGWTKFAVSFVADTSEVWPEIRWGATGPAVSPNVWVEGLLTSGQPADTVGGIWQQILDDATTDHTGEAGDFARDTLGFLDYTGFTGTLDSNGDAWVSGEPDGTISYTGSRGKRLARIKADHEQLGYELRVIDSATGPTLEAYNPYDYTTRTGGYGTDQRSVLPELRYRQGVTGGPVVVQVITPNIVHVEGADGLWERKKATTSFDAYELYQGENDLTSITTVTDLVDRVLEERNDPTLALKLRLDPKDTDTLPTPWSTFRVGDTLTLDLEGDYTGDKRVVKVTTDFTPGYGEYELEFDQTTYTSDPMKAVVEAVRRLLDQVADLLEPEGDILAAAANLEDTSPWDATFTVASYQATDRIRANADFVCDGIADDIEIDLALATAATHGRARVVLSDGIFNYTAATLTVSYNVAMYGIGRHVTIIRNGTGGTLAINITGGAWGRLQIQEPGE